MNRLFKLIRKLKKKSYPGIKQQIRDCTKFNVHPSDGLKLDDFNHWINEVTNGNQSHNSRH